MPSEPTSSRADAATVVRRLRDAGHVAYFAGGCVRDELLGRTPKDYDVATDAPPQRVRQLFPNTQAVGAAFGVILVRLGRSTIEVATFRTDGTYTDGRRPDTVTFATAEQDAQRRDFTINGLFLDPLDGDKVIDFVGGRADLDAKVIRAIGNPDERFAEDHLRMLRAVRFASRLGFEIEPTTAEAIRRHAAELPRISPERIADELRRILDRVEPGISWSALFQVRLIEPLFRLLPIDGPSPYADDLNTIFHRTGWLEADAKFGAMLAGLVLDWRWQRAGRRNDVRQFLSRPEIARVVRLMRQTFKITNEEAADMEGTLVGLSTLLNDPMPGVASLKRFMATPTAASATDLLWGLGFAGVHQPRVDWLQLKLASLRGSDVAPPPLVTGDDLTAAGATPGPAFKRALDAAYDAQLEDRVTDRPAALQVALDVIRADPAARSLGRP